MLDDDEGMNAKACVVLAAGEDRPQRVQAGLRRAVRRLESGDHSGKTGSHQRDLTAVSTVVSTVECDEHKLSGQIF